LSIILSEYINQHWNIKIFGALAVKTAKMRVWIAAGEEVDYSIII